MFNISKDQEDVIFFNNQQVDGVTIYLFLPEIISKDQEDVIF
jgi:hypothetical protein